VPYDLIYGTVSRRPRVGTLAVLVGGALCVLPNLFRRADNARTRARYSRGLSKTVEMPAMSDAEIRAADPLGVFSHR
jgi:hypothetical protein